MRKRITEKTIKKLFALSGNKCAFNGCNHRLVDKHGNIFAQICHIEAAEPVLVVHDNVIPATK